MGQLRNDTAAGYLVEGGELQITDSEGSPVPAGERGEIWMRGVGLMPGYFRDAEATAGVMKPGGWYASGDIGCIGPDGVLFVVGRTKEMIIRSGFNVYPGEIEAVLMRFQGIRCAAVVGRREPDGNEQILAFVEAESSEQGIDMEALKIHLQEHLTAYKRPSPNLAAT